MENENIIVHEIYNCENRIKPTKNINFFKKCFLESSTNNFSNNILKNSIEKNTNKISLNKSLILNYKIIDFKNLSESMDKFRNRKNYQIKFFTKMSPKGIEINKNNNISNELFNKYRFINNDSFIKNKRNNCEENNENNFSLSQFLLNHLKRMIKAKTLIFKKDNENNSYDNRKKEINKKFFKYAKIINKEKKNREQPEKDNSNSNIPKLKESNNLNDSNNISNNNNIKFIKKNSIVQLDFSFFDNKDYKDRYYLFDKIIKRNSDNKKSYVNNKNKKWISKLKKYGTGNKENDTSISKINKYDINESTDLPKFAYRRNNSFFEESKYSGEEQNSPKGIYPKSNAINSIHKPIGYNLKFIKAHFFKKKHFPKFKFFSQNEKKSNSFIIKYP